MKINAVNSKCSVISFSYK